MSQEQLRIIHTNTAIKITTCKETPEFQLDTLQFLKLLLAQQGVNPNVRNRNGVYPLAFAIARGSIEICKILVDFGADVNCINSDQCQSLLHIATDQGSVPLIRFLIQNGANVNLKNRDGITVLHKAALLGDLRICEALLESRTVNVNLTDNNCNTLLHIAALSNHIDICNLFIARGMDLNRSHDLILHSILQDLGVARKKRSKEKFRLINSIEEQEDIILNVTSDEPNFCQEDLKMSLFGSRIKTSEFANVSRVFKVLLVKGANPNAIDENGCSLLAIATYLGFIDACELLLDFKADVNLEVSKTSSQTWCDIGPGYSPLRIAIQHKNISICKLLIERGGDVNYTADSNFCLLDAVVCNSPAIVQILLERKCLIESNLNGWTALKYSAFKGYADACDMLLDYGADINFQCSSLFDELHNLHYSNRTALHVAISRKHVPLCKRLIQRGADLTILNEGLKSYFTRAVESKLPEVCEVLLEYKCPIDIADSFNKTPLAALLEKYIEMHVDNEAHSFDDDAGNSNLIDEDNDKITFLINILLKNREADVFAWPHALDSHDISSHFIFTALSKLTEVKFKRMLEMLVFSSADFTRIKNDDVAGLGNPSLTKTIAKARVLGLVYMFDNCEIHLDVFAMQELVTTLIFEFCN